MFYPALFPLYKSLSKTHTPSRTINPHFHTLSLYIPLTLYIPPQLYLSLSCSPPFFFLSNTLYLAISISLYTSLTHSLSYNLHISFSLLLLQLNTGYQMKFDTLVRCCYISHIKIQWGSI